MTGKWYPFKPSSREICYAISQARHQENLPRLQLDLSLRMEPMSGQYAIKTNFKRRRSLELQEQLPDPNLSSPPTSTTSPRTLNKSDNLLIHHFTTHTWRTLANNENMRQMWRVIVPRLAYQHEYLMHALLACAALHIAYLNPEQHSELTIKARTHQDHAIPLFLAAIPSVESKTCDAVLIFVRLMGIIVFALDERLFTVGEKEDKLPSWLFFIRSGCE